MKNFTKLSLLAAMILTCGSAIAAQISIGIAIGAPPPPPVVYMQPARPGLDFLWIEGYWYPVRGHYRWHDGYWVRPPYPGAYWVGPRYEGNRYYAGRWARSSREQGRWENNRDRRDRHWNRGYDKSFDRNHRRKGHGRD